MTEDELERIVREVVRRLIAERNRNDGVIASPSSGVPATLRIHDPVISMQTLEGKLEGIKDLLVTRSAVVTPLVRDELNTREIRLRRDKNSTSTSHVSLKVVRCGEMDAQRLVNTLDDVLDDSQVESLEQARDVLSHCVNGQTFGVLLTPSPEAAVCIINRDSSLHAFVGVSESNVRRARITMAANVIVLADHNVVTQRRLINVFRTVQEAL